jgi:hypothetical protein
MTKKQLRKAKRQIRKRKVNSLKFMGKVSYYLGAISFRIKNTGYETEMDWDTSMGVGTKYHFETTEIIYGFHPLIFLGYLVICIIEGIKETCQSLIEFRLIDKTTPRKEFHVEYYDKNKKI